MMQVPYREKCDLYHDTYSQNWAMKVHYEATVRIFILQIRRESGPSSLYTCT